MNVDIVESTELEVVALEKDDMHEDCVRVVCQDMMWQTTNAVPLYAQTSVTFSASKKDALKIGDKVKLYITKEG